MFVSDWMTKKVYTVTQNDSVSDAIKLLKEKKVKHLPVVKDSNKIVGILSDKDLFRVLVDITGVRQGGNRFYVVLKDKLGVTGEVLDVLRKHGFTLDSVLTTYEGVQRGYKRVVVRTKGAKGNIDAVGKELKELFGMPFM